MATLINGNGNPRIYAAQDADLIAALAGDITGIAQIGNKFAATAVDANTISVADGVIVTKEGRRIQLDAGSTDMFVIPTGTTGVTNYYIIGYKLTTQSDDSQIAETFVQLMSSSSETITEDTFRSGATDVYVSLYRVQQNGVNLGTITGLLPELTNISELKSDLSNLGTIYTLNYIDVTVPANGSALVTNTVNLPVGKYIVLPTFSDDWFEVATINITVRSGSTDLYRYAHGISIKGAFNNDTMALVGLFAYNTGSTDYSMTSGDTNYKAIKLIKVG